MVDGTHSLRGLRILVVEDNFLLAEVISDTLESYGCQVVGPAADVATAARLAREGEFDGAVLDINLFGEFCFPVVDALAERDIPFLFLTGYDNKRMIPPQYRSVPRLSKPVDPAKMATAISARFTQQPAS